MPAFNALKMLGVLFFLCYMKLYAQKAVVCVPVSDLYGTAQAADAPLDAQPSAACSRLMQLLFNEQVDVLKEHGDYLFIAIPHAFHIAPHNLQQTINQYWIKKTDILRIDALPKHIQPIIPPAVHAKKSKQHNSHVFTLTKSWYDHHAKQTYSAGTRFITTTCSQKSCEIIGWNYKTFELIKTNIPLEYGVVITCAHPKEQQAQFVQLLKNWAQQSTGVIPYVLGGCSYIQRYHTYNPRIIKTDDFACQVIDSAIEQPYTGFDCAGLVLRAAQCCGIPYYYKNTTTLAHFLQPIAPNEHLEEGDLIWIPGHVMIVSDLKKQLLIESRSFYHGYGKVQEIPLSEEFKDIATYDELLHALFNKQKLVRLNAAGESIQQISIFKILKLASVWR